MIADDEVLYDCRIKGKFCPIRERCLLLLNAVLCVGEINNVAGRVAVLAVVENNTVAYKSASAWCVDPCRMAAKNQLSH